MQRTEQTHLGPPLALPGDLGREDKNSQVDDVTVGLFIMACYIAESLAQSRPIDLERKPADGFIYENGGKFADGGVDHATGANSSPTRRP
jgi:hypothetical protein